MFNTVITAWSTPPSLQHHHGLPKMGTGHPGAVPAQGKSISCWHPKYSEVSTLESQGPWLQGLVFPIQHLSHPKVTLGCCTLPTVGETEAGSG